jgi:tripartite-type tricarboxylate transporter receptor subunit TctC
MRSKMLFARLVVGVAALLSAASAAAQSAPISLVVGYSAGGSADFVARVVGEELSKKLGRQVIIENVAGASGMLAAQKVLQGTTDGSVIYMGGTDTVLVPMVNPKVKLDWEKDFVPIGRTTTVPMIFAVPPNSPYSSLSSLIADLKKTGKDNYVYAIPGIGTMQHLYGGLINKNAQVSMVHVPYRGGAQIATDLVGGQIDAAVLVLSTAMPFLKDGKIKALSVSDVARVPQLPNVKRIGEEEGFQGAALPLWQGFFLKAGTPPNVVAAYEKALMEALASPQAKQKLADAGVTIAPMKGEAFKAFIKPQAELYREIVRSAKITVD